MIVLTEIEQIGIKVVALARSGLLENFKCSTCTTELQEYRNCKGNEDYDISVFYNEEVGEFYACPLTFISEVVMQFFDMYDYYEKYPSSIPPYEELNPRYWASVKFYENFKNTLTNSEGSATKNKKSNDNMSKMKSLFKNKG